MPPTQFPLKPLDALRLSLFNHPYVHRQMSVKAVREALQDEGDFLVQTYDKGFLLLSVRVGDRINEFPVGPCYCAAADRVGFALGGHEFGTLAHLVKAFSVDGGHIETSTDSFRLGRPICRGHYAGRFGYGEFLEIQSQARPDKLERSFVRSLRAEFTTLANVEDELERLTGLKYRHIAQVLDYARYDMGPRAEPVILLRCEAYERNLYKHLVSLKGPMRTRHYVAWAYQIAKALDYLMTNGIYHRRLSPRACLLNDADDIKLSDYWTHTDADDAYLFEKVNELVAVNQPATIRRDGWRFLPVETLMGESFATSSQVWCYALLLWHVFNHCEFINRAHYACLVDFLEAGAKDDQFYMPGTLSRGQANKGMPEIRRRMMAFYKASQQMPRATGPLNELIPRCLVRDPSTRPQWSEVMATVGTENRITSVSGVIGHFF